MSCNNKARGGLSPQIPGAHPRSGYRGGSRAPGLYKVYPKFWKLSSRLAGDSTTDLQELNGRGRRPVILLSAALMAFELKFKVVYSIISMIKNDESEWREVKAALVSIENLKSLENLVDEQVLRRACQQEALAEADALREAILARRGGVTLPDSVEDLRQLREGRIRDNAPNLLVAQ